MVKTLASFVLGAVVAAVIAWLFVIPQIRESYHGVGYNDGRVSAQSEIADQIDKAFGNDLLPTEPREVLYNVKSSSVVVVDRNGVKTLRTVR
jgi:hypothetical protein